MKFFFIIGCYAPCKIEFDKLVEKKRYEFHVNSKKMSSVTKTTADDQHPSPGWKPKGQLIAHLHEHQVRQNPREFLYSVVCQNY